MLPAAALRPTVAHIDLAALAHNLQLARQCTAGQTLCAVVKANAYGHGMVRMAQALQKLQIDSFGVAFVEEAVALREAGITRPILVWAARPELALATYVTYALTPVLGSLPQLQACVAQARAQQVVLEFHLEVDTGMARQGLAWELLPQFFATLQVALQHVRLGGLMTHMACAEFPETPFNAVQVQRFAQAQQLLQASLLPNTAQVHLANSPASLHANALKLHTCQPSMARCGLLLYGLQPLPQQQVAALRPVLQLHSGILSLRELPGDTPVSYGCRYRTPKGRTSRLATLPIGYADGFRRAFSNRAHVLIRGQQAPVVGTVCMDMCMVDVSGIQGVELDDPVVLLGRQADAAIAAEDWAAWGDTINYEIVCGLGSRVRRHYINEPT